MKLTWIMLLALPAVAETPKNPTKTVDYALYSGVLTARTLDFVSTEQVLSHHGHEEILPNSLVSNKPAFAVLSIGFGVAEIYASRLVMKTHPKLARAMLAIDIGGTTAVASHNFAVVPKEGKMRDNPF